MMSEIELPLITPRDYQMDLWSYMQSGKEGKRAVCVWHRRTGKDLTAINICAAEMVERVGLYWHLLPTYQQGRKIVWNGMTREGKKFLDYLPKELYARDPNKTEMSIEFINGSIYQVIGTDEVDRLVGSNPVGCIFSEFSLQDPKAWDYIRPILRENGGWAIFIYTPRGRNHGYDLYNMATNNAKWFAQTLSINDTGIVSPEAIVEERASGMPEELIKQEFYCSFDASLVGAYYGGLLEKAAADNRIGAFPYDPKLPVCTSWDLGMHDSMAIWFFQVHYDTVRVIEYYEDHGKGFEFYAQVIKERAYVYDYHVAPWDINVRELGTGRSRIEVALGFGIRFRANPRIKLEEGINAVRQLIPKCYFNSEGMVSEANGTNGLEALKQFRKDWDSKKKQFRDSPTHDWTSHGASAFKELAWGLRRPVDVSNKPTIVGGTVDHDPLAYDDFWDIGNVTEVDFG